MITIDRVIILDHEAKLDTYLESGARDYAVNYIFDNNINNYIFLDDNIHSNPNTFFSGYLAALARHAPEERVKVRTGVLQLPKGADTYSQRDIRKNYNNVIWED